MPTARWPWPRSPPWKMMATLTVLLGKASVVSGVAVVFAARAPRIRKLPGSAVPAGWMPVLSAMDLTQHLGIQVRIDALRTKTSLTPANFERDYGQTIGRFMAFVQLLPASESHHHAQPGGLLLHALETKVGLNEPDKARKRGGEGFHDPG